MYRKPVNLVGRQYGQLIVIAQAENDAAGNRRWLCRCECGTEKVILATAFVYGKTTSCGCTRYQRIGDKKRTHGRSKTNLYLVWQAMINRCYRPETDSYPKYGGRGVQVCDRWRRSFENFVADMGERPKGHSIERNDRDGNYEPSNCRWATATEQGRNKSNNVMITAFGETRCLSDWAEKLNFSPSTLKKRLSRGISGEDLFSDRNRKNKASI